MSKVDREVATTDVQAWLDRKKIFPEMKDRFKDQIENLVDAVCNAVLIFNDDGTITHKLLFPLGEGENISQLTYMLRVTDKLMQPNLRGVKADDLDGRLNALIATLTKENKGIISALESSDKRIASSIAIFFM